MNSQYVILSLISLLLGGTIYFKTIKVDYALIVYFFVLLFAQSGFADYYVYSSFYFFWFFTLAIFPLIVYLFAKKLFFVCYLLFAFFVLVLLGIYSQPPNFSYQSYLRDVFMTFQVMFVSLFFLWYKKKDFGVSLMYVKYVFAFVFLLNFLFDLYAYFFAYQHYGSVRYADFGYGVLLGYLTTFMIGGKRIDLSFVFALFAVVLFGQRSSFIPLFVLFVLCYRFNYRMLLLSVIAFYFYLNLDIVQGTVIRFFEYNIFDLPEYYITNRFYPFVLLVQDFSFKEYIVGAGPGLNFYIPWFEGYQFGHDNVYNHAIDNTFLTLYAKFGFFSFFYYVFFVWSFLWYFTGVKAYYLLLFLFIVAFHNPLFYSPYFQPMMLSMAFFYKYNVVFSDRRQCDI